MIMTVEKGDDEWKALMLDVDAERRVCWSRTDHNCVHEK